MKEGNVPLCYDCLVFFNLDKEQLEHYIEISAADRTAKHCFICNRWTLEGISGERGFSKLYAPGKAKDIN
jgi:hypothetical protein